MGCFNFICLVVVQRLKHHYPEEEYKHVHLEDFTLEDLSDGYIQLTEIDCSDEIAITVPHKVI